MNKSFGAVFEDYSPASASSILEGNQLKKNWVVYTKFKPIWRSVLDRLEGLERSDYSVYTGTGGAALLKLMKLENEGEDLKELKRYLPIARLKNRTVTFLCGDSGPVALMALISHRLRDKADVNNQIKRLKLIGKEARNPASDLPNEVMYGRAGYLYSLLFVNKYISPPPIEDSFIREVIENIITCGKSCAESGKHRSPLMYEWHGKFYLGAAHGVAGIMYMLLQAKKYLQQTELNDFIRPTIDYLATLKFKSGNFLSSLESDTDRLVQWCHGAPGFVHLFCLAYKTFGYEKYLEIALKCGDVVWSRGLLRKGYSICHGVAGNAYSFLELYQTTQDVKHLYRAAKFAEWCIDYDPKHEEHRPDRPLSLFEGCSGVIYFLFDMQDPMNAKFPGYTV